jgi:ketosteroid isomerase-like protein
VTPSDVPDAIRRYFDGLNHEDWEDFTGIWTEDAELVGVGARTRTGREDVMTYYSTVLVPYPVHHDDPYAVHVSGDIVTVEIRFTGETHEGVPVEFEAVDVFTLRDGRIARLTTWYDIDRVRKLASRPGPPERRLRTLLAYAAARSPFYRRRFEELGLDPEAVAADLSLLPPTTGLTSELAVVEPGKAAQLLVGEGWVLPLTGGDVDELDATLAAALAVAGVTADDDVVSLVPHRGIAAAVAKLKARLVVPAGPGAAGLGSASVAFAPSHADVDAARGQVRLVVGTADGVDRRFLGSPETGVIAAACGHGSRLHVLESQHVEIGEQAELLVTPLGRRGAPLLRYATGDRARFRPGSACPCGSTLAQLELLP